MRKDLRSSDGLASARSLGAETPVAPPMKAPSGPVGTRTLPPAGTILKVRDLASVLSPKGPEDRRTSLETALSTTFKVPHVRLFSTGRAAMTVVLKAMAQLRPQRRAVIVPGYTCYSVAASVLRTGLSIRPVDVDAATLTYLPQAIETAVDSDVLCIVSGNLFGKPDALPQLEALAKANGAFLLDDAAQAMFARCEGRFVGTFGDAGILSFDKGKNITTIEGGAALLPNPELREAVGSRWDCLPNSGPVSAAQLGMKALAYSWFLRPHLYTLPARTLSLGETPFELDFPLSRYNMLLAPLAERLLDRIEEVTEERRTRARWLRDAIPQSPLISAPTADCDSAVHLRFPLVLATRELRDRVLLALSEARLGATRFYPAALIDIPELRGRFDFEAHPTPNAQSLAKRILTLPTHEYVTPTDVQAIGNILRRAIARRT